MADYEQECTHSCDTCGVANCPSRAGEAQGAEEDNGPKLNEYSSCKKVIGIISGKGGVGKSMVTGLSAVIANRQGFETGILDADITGPSIPKMFGLHGPISAIKEGILPAETESGIRVMSLNLLTENETDPVIWRGPVITGTVTQFWTDVVWGDLDVMFIDMPPGTGDVALTIFQSLPVDGLIIVTSPQELVSMIVEKAVKMAQMMNVPILGIVENMSYFECPECDHRIEVFGESHVDQIAEQYGLKVIDKLPIDPALAKKADKGEIESTDSKAMEPLIAALAEIGLVAE